MSKGLLSKPENFCASALNEISIINAKEMVVNSLDVFIICFLIFCECDKLVTQYINKSKIIVILIKHNIVN